MPMVENSTILFSESLFILPMTVIVLREKVSIKSWIATAVGFIGLIIMFRPDIEKFNVLAIIPTFAAFLFAVMSIMLKTMVDKKENNLTMLFYFSVYTTIITAVFVPFFWISPTLSEICLLGTLGLGANLIQLFLFLAYRATSASIIAPLHYTELPFATCLGFCLFGQIPDSTAIFGASLIIAGTFINSQSKSGCC
jgi:drug/metabolite transporter (DMT)-like permease